MATSGSTDYTRTATQLISGALRDIGALAAGETAAAEDTAAALESLNLLIKGWQTEGIGLWLNDTFSITLVANQASYTMGSGGDVSIARPLELVEARFRYSSNSTDIPMIPLMRDEYFRLSNKATAGVPTQYYFDPQLALCVFYIWPVWDTTPAGSIVGTVKTTIEDFDSLANTSDLPPEALRALRKNLAIEIAPEMGREPSRILVAQALESKRNLMNHDRESSVMFGLERR